MTPRRTEGAEDQDKGAVAIMLCRPLETNAAGGFVSTTSSEPVEDRQGRRRAPGTTTSTGMTSATPPTAAKLGPKTPPEIAQAPIATTRLGAGIAS